MLEDGDEFRRSCIYVSGLIRERYDFKMQYDFAGGDASRLMHLAIGYSYRGDDTATYKLSSDHSLAPNWKHKVSDVDNKKVLSLEGALKLGPFSLQSEWVEADVDASEGGNLDGYYVQAGYVFTGESRSYDKTLGAFKGVSPPQNLWRMEVLVLGKPSCVGPTSTSVT